MAKISSKVFKNGVLVEENGKPVKNPFPKMTKEEISRMHHLNPDYAVMYDLVDTLCEIYQVKVKVVFRNCQRSYATKRAGQYFIVFGHPAVRDVKENGFIEYATLEHIVPKPRPKGKDAIRWLVLHEFAHILQCENNEVWHGSVHNQYFVNRYKELIDLVL